MSAFLRSVKADLLDRRLLAGVVLLTLALAAALAYAVLGGNSTAVSVAPVAPAGTGSVPVAAAGISISQGSLKSADASTETASSSYQRGGSLRNPFAPPPAAKAKSAGASAKGSSSSHTTNSSSTKATPQPASKKPAPAKATPAPAPKTSKPKVTATPDRVSVLFGEVPAGIPTQDLRLTPYENLAPLTPLPSTKLPLLVYSGTAANGKLASFARAGEVVLHGSAACSPSPAQCLTIELEAGESEQVEYLPAGGKPVVYELEIVSISPGKS